MSVIIPTYNRANLLLEAIASVRAQTWPHIQIIVADDSSTDNTAELMQGMPDVCYVRQDHRGQGAARNLGLRHAKGAFICSLDSDDVWEPDFIESGIGAIRTLNVDFVFSNWVGLTASGTRFTSNFEEMLDWINYPEADLEGWRTMEPEQARAVYMDSCISPSSSLILTRELVAGGWREDLKLADDWCVLLDLVSARPCRVAFSTRPLWLKRVCGDNISYHAGDLDAKRYLFISDCCMLLKRFWTKMTAKERAWFFVKIAARRIGMVKWEVSEKRYWALPGLILAALGCLVRAFMLSPGTILKVAQKMDKRKPHNRAIQSRRNRHQPPPGILAHTQTPPASSTVTHNPLKWMRLRLAPAADQPQIFESVVPERRQTVHIKDAGIVHDGESLLS